MKKGDTSPKLRIAIAPLEISGIYRQLQIGLIPFVDNVTFYKLFPDGYTDFENVNVKCSIKKKLRYINDSVEQARATRSNVFRIFFKCKFLFWSCLLFVQSLFHTDIYLFSWGMSFLPMNLDLLILKIFRKRTICVVGHGSEARPPFIGNNGFSNQTNEISDEALKSLRLKTRRVKRKMQRIERWAGIVVGLPTTSHFLTKPFINFYELGIPCEANLTVRHVDQLADTDAFRIIHAPSKPTIKGSAIIRDAVSKIQSRHNNVEYLEISGVSNEEVLSAIKKADLVIDQAWSDIPMATVGVEAAALGVPSVTFGHAKEIWSKYAFEVGFPIEGYLPTDSILEDIERLVMDKRLRTQLGKAQHEFVTNHWSRESVAKRYLEIMSGEIPRKWIIPDGGSNYFDGAGVSKKMAHLQMAMMSRKFGSKSLCLGPNSLRQIRQLIFMGK